MWRRLDFGDLASLLLLDTRHGARTETAQLLRREELSGRIHHLLKSAGYPPPDKWPGSKLEKDLEDLSAQVEVESHRKDNTILGKEQLAWIEKHVEETSKSGVQWRLVAQPLVLQSQIPPDYEAAVKKAHAAGSADLAVAWGRDFQNVTAGKPDSARKRAALLNLVSGRYKISLGGDGWMSFAAERKKLMTAFATGESSSTLVYGGNSHNGWAGTMREPSGKAVAVEFAGMSVSSPGIEFYEPRFPPALEAAGWKASNNDMEWADTHNRGFMLVSLDRNGQHLEYRGVDTKTQGKLESTCLSAFGVARGSGPRRADCKDAVSLAQASSHRQSQAGLRRGAASLSVSR